jgi:hypothetical protein
MYETCARKEKIMINKIQRSLVSVILLILFAVNAVAQLELGPHRMVTSRAPVLSNPTRLKIGLAMPRFVGRVGGIAFDATAKPDNGFVFRNISLNYRPDQPDGQRLKVIFDEREVTARIYDWQLIPIAKFADSRFFSCVTLFGTLEDPGKEQEVWKQGGRIINYHADFENTLVGLRLFQLDSLIFDEYCADLPKLKGQYILGKGESAPNLTANQAAFSSFKDYMEELGRVHQRYRSYIINDLGSDIRFGISGNFLNITGEPQYYFWKTDPYAFFNVEEKVEQELRAAARKRPFNAKAWLMLRVMEKAKEFQENYDSDLLLQYPRYLYLEALLAAETNLDRKKYLQQQTAASLEIMLIDLRKIMETEKPVPLTEVSRQVSSQPDLLRKINPAVWDSGVNVMRYAAFFRYYKQKSPQQWQSFITQIRRLTGVEPSLETPTVIYYYANDRSAAQ